MDQQYGNVARPFIDRFSDSLWGVAVVFTTSLESSVIGSADFPKSVKFQPSNLMSRCDNNPPKVNKKELTTPGVGQSGSAANYEKLLKLKAYFERPQHNSVKPRSPTSDF